MSTLSRTFLLFLILIGAANSRGQASAGVVTSSFIGASIPIVLSADVTSASSETCTVSVSIQVNQVGDSIQIGCDHPSLINSPSSSWPYVYAYATGTSTTRTFTFTTNSVAQNTVVQIYACPTGVDSSVSSNWSVSTSVTLPASGPMLALSQSSKTNAAKNPIADRPGMIAALFSALPSLSRQQGVRGLLADGVYRLNLDVREGYTGLHSPGVEIASLRSRADIRTGGLG